MTILSANKITMGYDHKIAVDAVSFEVENGDYLCIVGENGSGKSTLIKGILGLHKIKSGTLQFGKDMLQTEIGYLPQQTIVQKDFPASVNEVVLSGCLNKRGHNPFYGKKEKERARQALLKLDISAIKNKSYRDLSGGQQQRVLLARALCATEKMLVLDEPVTGLDPLITAEFYVLVKKLNQENNITVLMVSHDIHTALENADKILHIGKKVLFFGTTQAYVDSAVSTGFMGGHHE